MRPCGITVSQALSSAKLFEPHYSGPSWSLWRAILKSLFGESLSDAELELFHEVAGDRDVPVERVREAVLVIGRSGGKTAVAAFIACYLAMRFDPKASNLRVGESAWVMIVALDKEQAGQCFAFIREMFQAIPTLRAMIKNVGRDAIELKNKVVVKTVTNSYRSIRGRSLLACVLDEVGYWFSGDSVAVPDTEVYTAVKPGLARVKDRCW